MKNIAIAVIALPLLSIAVTPTVAKAKLGEEKAELIKRFGTNYRPNSPGRFGEEGLLFESRTLTVNVTLVGGRSVQELYFSKLPLVAGRPPADLWKAVREKNVPGASWQKNGDNGFATPDGVFTTWFTPTTEAGAEFTFSVAINNQLKLKGFNAVNGEESPYKPGGKPPGANNEQGSTRDAAAERGGGFRTGPAFICSPVKGNIEMMIGYVNQRQRDKFDRAINTGMVQTAAPGEPIEVIQENKGGLIKVRRASGAEVWTFKAVVTRSTP